jgi:hypothetical protein
MALGEGLTEAVRERRWWPVLAPLAVIAIGVSLLLPAGRHEWALSLFRQPTHYTALSFNQAWALPASVPKGEPIAISFSVANHEGRAIRYRYVLGESPAGSSAGYHAIQGSARVIPDGSTWTVSTSIEPSCVRERCRVEVSLPGHPETIDFFVNLVSIQDNNG